MAAGLVGFITTWSPSFYSTQHRIQGRNVIQGGGDLLAVEPQVGQSMWAGSVLNRVSEVALGPIQWGARSLSFLLHPVINLPLSVISCAVKEGLYESSATATLEEQTRYFERGAEVSEPVLGTVSFAVDGVIRHFTLGNDITYLIENSVEDKKDGEKGRFYYRRLASGETFDAECREIHLNGEKVRVRLSWKVPETNYFELTIDGRRFFRELGNEVAEPIQGTVSIGRRGEFDRHYRMGKEIRVKQPGCIEVRAGKQTLHYETGRELAGPETGSRSFLIHGRRRHFATAKLVFFPTLGLSGWFNLIPKIPFKLPTRLSRFTIRVLELINKHMSNAVRVALLVSAAIFSYFGYFYMAAGAVLAVSYEYLDHDLGIIPGKVSLFMEKWMPTISMVGLLIVGSAYAQVMAAVSLLLMVPSAKLWTHQKISRLTRRVILTLQDQLAERFTKGASSHARNGFQALAKEISSLPILEECDASLVENKNLNKGQIDEILTASDVSYELNPAHYTKMDPPLLKLSENFKFNELIRLWNESGPKWIEPNAYARLVRRLADGKRFILFLKRKFPEAKRFQYKTNWRIGYQENRRACAAQQTAHRGQIEEWIRILAQEKKCTMQQFVADWVRQQLQFFVDKLSNERPIEGEQQKLSDAIQNTAKIIPFLLKPEMSRVEREDILVKLAIEGGDYCSLAMRRVSSEVLEGLVQLQEEQALQSGGIDAQKAFEGEVCSTFRRERLRLIQDFYNQGIVKLFQNKEEMSDTGEDIHLYTAITRVLKRGFYPLDRTEVDEFTLTELMLRETVLLPVLAIFARMYRMQFEAMMNNVSIDRKQLNRNRVLEYLRAWVVKNSALRAEERKVLLDGPLSNTDQNLTDHSNYPRWNRLMLVVLGILRKQTAPA